MLMIPWVVAMVVLITHKTHPNVVSDKVNPHMARALPDSMGHPSRTMCSTTPQNLLRNNLWEQRDMSSDVELKGLARPPIWSDMLDQVDPMETPTSHRYIIQTTCLSLIHTLYKDGPHISALSLFTKVKPKHPGYERCHHSCNNQQRHDIEFPPNLE